MTTTARCRSMHRTPSPPSWRRSRSCGTRPPTWPSKWFRFTGTSTLKSTGSLPTRTHGTTRTSPTPRRGRSSSPTATPFSAHWPARLRRQARASPRTLASTSSMLCTPSLHAPTSFWSESLRVRRPRSKTPICATRRAVSASSRQTCADRHPLDLRRRCRRRRNHLLRPRAHRHLRLFRQRPLLRRHLRLLLARTRRRRRRRPALRRRLPHRTRLL
jgi:hypothetical protein